MSSTNNPVDSKARYVQIRSEVRITGQDYEMADYTNPQGHIYGNIYYLVASTGKGKLYSHFKAFEEEEKAKELLTKVELHMAAGGSLNMDHWAYTEDAYGSDEYVKNGGEWELIEWERQQEYGLL